MGNSTSPAMAGCPISSVAAPVCAPRSCRPTGSSPTYLVARNGSGIDTIADIKGKKISLSRGTILQLSLNSLLERQNLTEKDIQLFDLITADQISAIQSGDVDAVVGTSSVLALVERGFGKIVFSTKGKLDPASNFGSFVVIEDFAKKYPQTTQRVLQAFLRAAHFASQEENRNELYDIWARAGQSRAAVATDYDGDSLRQRTNPLLDEFYVANVKRGVKFSVDSKLIKQGFDVELWVDRKEQELRAQVARLREFLEAPRCQGTTAGLTIRRCACVTFLVDPVSSQIE